MVSGTFVFTRKDYARKQNEDEKHSWVVLSDEQMRNG